MRRLLRVAAFLLVPAALGPTVAAAGPAAPPPPLPSAGVLRPLIEDVLSVAPDPRGVSIHARVARIAHLELRFDDGTLVPLRSRGGEIFGLLFEGEGRYRYASDDDLDRAALRVNAAALLPRSLYGDDAVSDRLRRCVILFARPALADLWNGPGGGAPLPPGAVTLFARIWKRLLEAGPALDPIAAEGRLNGGDTQFLFAYLQGRRVDVGYRYDRLQNFEESLIGYGEGGATRLLGRVLSRQAIDGGPAAHPAALTLRDGRFDVATADNRGGTIDSDLTFDVGRDGLRVARLRLMNHRDPRAAGWDSQHNRLVVRRVLDDTGRELPFVHRYHEILVELPRTLDAGATLRLRFETAGEVFTGLDGTRENNYFELMSPTWFPQPFGWYPAGITFGIRVRTRLPYRPIASGRTVARRQEGEDVVLETRGDRPTRGIAILGGRYLTREERLGDLPIRFHAYAMARDEVLRHLPELTAGFLRWYERNLGPYPFAELDVVEIPERGFGSAPAGMVLINTGPSVAKKDYLDPYFSRGLTWRLSHQVAHQWFWHKAVPATGRDTWLSESVAEYIAALATQEVAPPQRPWDGLPRTLDGWRAEAMECRDAGSIETATLLSGTQGDRLRQCLLEARGPLVLHMLRALVGDDAFFTSLRTLLGGGDIAPATTAAFRGALEAALGRDLGRFFQDWYREGGIPELRLATRIAAVPGGFRLNGRVTQQGIGSPKRLVLPVVIEFPGGRSDERRVVLEGKEAAFTIDLTERPRRVLLDPRHDLLAIVR
jgi:Peptidase family M1 domain